MKHIDKEVVRFNLEYQDGYVYVEGLVDRVVEEDRTYYKYDQQNFTVNFETEDTFDQWELPFTPIPIYEIVMEVLDKECER